MFLYYIYSEILGISSLNTYDYVSIIANYIMSSSDSKPQSIKDRGYSKEVLELLEKKINKNISSTKMLNVQFSTDLEQFRIDNYDYLVELYDAFDKGILPDFGNYMEQSNQIIEIIQTIRSCQFEWETKQQEAHRKEMKK